MHNTDLCRWTGVGVDIPFETGIEGIHNELKMDSSLYLNISESQESVKQNRKLFGNIWVRKLLFNQNSKNAEISKKNLLEKLLYKNMCT